LANLLIVDDDRTLVSALSRQLRGSGHRLRTCNDVASARRALATGDVDIVVTDFRIGGASGLDVLEAARQLPSPQRCDQITASMSNEEIAHEHDLGPRHDLLIPIQLKDLLAALPDDSTP
jgi:DNA-binding NtrC family response regulator